MKVKLAVVSAVAVIAVIAVVYFATRPPANAAAKVGDHIITKDQVAALTAGTNVSKDDATTALMNDALYGDIAAKEGVSVSDSVVSDTLTKRTGSAHPYEEAYLRASIKAELLQQAIEAHQVGYAKGQFLIIHFDQHLPFAGRDDVFTNPPDKRDKQIAADRTYADAFIKQTQTLLASNNKDVAFAAAVTREQQDPYLGAGALPTVLHSGSFDTSQPDLDSTRLFKANDQIQALLAKTAAKSISQPTVIKVAEDPTDHPKMADGYYLMLKVDSAVTKQSQTFDQLVQAQKKHGYRRFA